MVQYCGSFAETVPLSVYQWLFCVGVASLTLPWGKVLRSLSTGATPILPSPPAMSPEQVRNAKKGWTSARKLVTQVAVINALKNKRQEAADKA